MVASFFYERNISFLHSHTSLLWGFAFAVDTLEMLFP